MTTIEPGVVERLQGLLEKATRVRPEWNIRCRDGEDHYQLIGVPCGFPVATFGDAADAEFDLACRESLPSLLALLAQQQARIGEMEAAAERALNYITNTEGELGITLECGEMLRAALATKEPT